jgi:O-antigen/teichoic acid export membrane protein
MTADGPGDHRPPARRVARNTAFRATAEVIGKLASLVLFAFIARALGAETLGNYVFALSVGQLIWAGAGFGLDQMALRDIARERGAVDRLFFNVVGFKLFFGVLGVAAATAVIAAFGYSQEAVLLVAILGLALVLALVTETAQTVFQAYERMEYYMIAYLPNKVIAALLGILLLAAGAGIVAVAVGALVAALASLAVAGFLLYRFFARPRPRLTANAWPALIRSAVPFGVQEIAGVVLYRVDVVLLSALTSSVVVGVYGAGYRLLEATFFLAWSVGQSVLPMFSYLDRRSEPTLDGVLEGSLKLMTAVMMPVAILFLVCAEPIIELIFGLPEYAEAVPVLRWLAFATLAYALANMGSTFILVRLPGRVTIPVFVSAAALNLILNLVLIPPFEAVGAAISTLVAEIALVVAVLTLATRVVDPPRWRSIAGGPVVAGAAMLAAAVPLADRLWLAAPSGVLVYLLVLLAFEARSARGDLEIAREVLRLRSTVGATGAETASRPAAGLYPNE